MFYRFNLFIGKLQHTIMGISGLTSFINNNPTLLKEINRLEKTRVIIDGGNILYPLYFHAHLDSTYGGEYVAFEITVRSFFEMLRDFDVEPIIIMDGSCDRTGAKQDTWVCVCVCMI